MTYLLEIKIDDGNSQVGDRLVEAAQSFEQKLEDEEKWEFPVTITIEQPGTNRVIFELWSFNATADDWEFTGNWVNLSIEALQAN